jgi:metal-responsive CopG/Arc/MetJ family transcriptional regulator
MNPAGAPDRSHLEAIPWAEGMNYGRNEGMKTKVSVSLPRDLLQEIDDEAAETSRSRSQIFEVWLRLAARRRAAEELERDTLAYYTSRTAEQEAEDQALSRASQRAAKKREID